MTTETTNAVAVPMPEKTIRYLFQSTQHGWCICLTCKQRLKGTNAKEHAHKHLTGVIK